MEELSSKLIVDPDQLEGVVAEIPEGASAICLLDGYSSEKLVKCAFCKQKQRHYRGYFARLSSGEIALAGNCCAISIDGRDTVRRIRKSVERKESVARLLREKQALRDLLSLFILRLDNFWVSLEKSFQSERNRLLAFLHIERSLRVGDIEAIHSRLTASLNDVDERYHDKKEDALKSFLISCAMFERAVDQIIVLLDQFQNPQLYRFCAESPRAQLDGKPVISENEISFPLMDSRFRSEAKRIQRPEISETAEQILQFKNELLSELKSNG